MNKAQKDKSKLILLVGLALVVAAVDIGTKKWAEKNLATPYHPLPIKVTKEDQGKSVAQLIEERYGVDVRRRGSVEKLASPLNVAEETRLDLDLLFRVEGFYVFLDKQLETPPRFLPNPAAIELQKLKTQYGINFDRQKWEEKWRTDPPVWKDVLHQYLEELSEGEIKYVLDNNLIYPAFANAKLQNPDKVTVRAGEVYLLLDRKIDIIPGLLRFSYAENKGAVWGIFKDSPRWVRMIVLQFLTVVAAIVVLVVYWRTTSEMLVTRIALASVLGGAVGNFVGRIGRGYVVDFIDMYIKNAHWPTYNVADIAITLGVIALLVEMLRKKSPLD